MASLAIRRIDCGSEDAASQLQRVRNQLSDQGNVVSAKGRALTEKVFGEALAPSQVVERVCQQIQEQGIDALLHFTKQFDQAELTPQMIRVSNIELAQAHIKTDPAFLETVRRIAQRVTSFQSGILHKSASMTLRGKYQLRLRYRPMNRVGVMIPGGAAAYPSTLLMTVCPARAAGVPELAVVMPPTPNGAYNQTLLAVCHELGVEEVYRIGGAQAVASLAYGVEGLPPVDMVVGPGNLFVALAKKYVNGQVAIDCIAGPSEVVVLADDSAPAAYVASDLIAQAEHAPGASILITQSDTLIESVHVELDKQLAHLDRGELARESLEQFGALVLARDDEEMVELTNLLGPEHLHIATQNAEALCEQIDNAGAIFLGNHTPVALGDYVAGPSHVLPTGGTARFSSGLSANDFLKRTSVLSFSQVGLDAVADDVLDLAEREGLTGHAASVALRQSAPSDNGPATLPFPSEKEPS